MTIRLLRRAWWCAAGIVFTVTAVAARIDEPAVPTPRAEPARPLPGTYDGFEPAVAADSAGRVVVAAIHRNEGEPKAKADRRRDRIIAWHSTDGGKEWGQPQHVQPQPDDFGPQFDPWLQTDGRGRFFLAYLAAGRFPADPAKDAVVSAYVQQSADGGKTWEAPHAAWQGTLIEPDKTVLALSPDARRLVLAWVSSGGGALKGLLQIQQSTDGGQRWDVLPSPTLAKRAPPGPPSGLVVTDRGVIALGWISQLGARSHQVAVGEEGGKAWTLHRWESVAAAGSPTSSVALALDGAQALHAVSVRAAAAGVPAAVLHRRSADGLTWSDPAVVTEAPAGAELWYPVLAAAGTRLHVAWVERSGDWRNVWYRASHDGGKTWTDRILLSRAERPTETLTAQGFRVFNGHYMSIAEDGRGTAHVVWGARQDGKSSGEIWHARVRGLGATH